MRETIWIFLKREHPQLAHQIEVARRRNLDTFDGAMIGPRSRAYVWDCIKRFRPELAALIADEKFCEAKLLFGARIELPIISVYRAIAKDRKVSRAVRKAMEPGEAA